MNAAALEALAIDAHERANLPDWFPDGLDLAQALGVVVLKSTAPAPGLAHTDGVLPWVERRAMYVQPGPNDAVSLRIFRGLAVILLAEQPEVYDRNDVERLTLALAIPADRIEYVDCFVQWIPAQAVRQRLEALAAHGAKEAAL